MTSTDHQGEDDFPCCSRDSFGRHDHRAVIVGGHNNEPTGSTPPANDVREALAQVIQNAEDGDLTANGWSRRPGPGQRRAADAILAAFEVCPRGTVTDTEVKAAAYAMYSAECRRQGLSGPLKAIHEPGWSEGNWSKVARAALEAAVEARRA